MEYSSHEKAIEWFKTGLKVCANDQERSQLWGYIGDVYHDMGNDKRAFKAYRKALGYNPENVLVLNNYAYFLSLLDQDLERALIMSKKAVNLESNNASYVDTYAWILHRLGRNDEAKKMMMTALSLSAQREPSLLIHYGDILWALGEKFMADTYWKKAVEQGYDKHALEEHIAEVKAGTTKLKSKKR
jgi:Tfp pilus assembly protein PilF